MIPHGVDVFIGLEPIDLRWGFDRLSAIVQERIGRDPRGGALFVFFGRRRDALKIVFADGSGLCLFYKRLDRRTFRLPTVEDASVSSVEIGDRELDDLLDGVEVVPRPPRPRRPRLN